jgi:hypothetical protein
MLGQEFRGRLVIDRFQWVAFERDAPFGLVDIEVYEGRTASVAIVSSRTTWPASGVSRLPGSCRRSGGPDEEGMVYLDLVRCDRARGRQARGGSSPGGGVTDAGGVGR